jgi:hypothetical protein
LREITMGCITYGQNTEVVFSVGELSPGGQLKKFNAHKWAPSRTGGRWEPHKIFDDYVSASAPAFPAKIVTLSTPLSPTACFIGRDEKLEEIRAALDKEQKVVLVNGIGGIGKTEICRNLFRECGDTGWAGVEKIGWLTFHSDLSSTLAGQFTEVKYSEGDKAEHIGQIERYLNEAGRGMLLFVDNANDISAPDALRLDKLRCRVILTSRLEKIERMQAIPVDRLSQGLPRAVPLSQRG